MGLEQMTSLRLDPVWWEEREARRSARDERPTRAASAVLAPRDPRAVAMAWIADREAKFRAGGTLDRADQAYVLVLARRHDLALASDFERQLRAALGWQEKRPMSQPLELEPQEVVFAAALC